MPMSETKTFITELEPGRCVRCLEKTIGYIDDPDHCIGIVLTAHARLRVPNRLIALTEAEAAYVSELYQLMQEKNDE